MFTLLIVEEDQSAPTSLSALADWETLGFHAPVLARSREEALTLCDQLRPDVLLAANLSPDDPLRGPRFDTLYVPARGYAVLSAARHALLHEPEDVLPAPPTPGAMRALLTSLSRRLKEAASRREHSAMMRAIFCLMDGDESLTIRQWLRELGIPEPPVCRLMTCQADEAAEAALRQSLSGAATLLRTGRDKVTILYPAEPDQPPLTDPPLPCGMSAPVAPDSSLLEAYQQSDVAYHTACFFARQEPVNYQPQGSDAPLNTALEEIVQALNAGQYLLARSLLASLHRQMEQLDALQIARVYNFLREHFQRRLSPELFPGQPLDYRQLCHLHDSLDSLLDPFDQCLAARLPAGKLQFDDVLRIINANYTHNLRISDLARLFHFSSSYFSTLFREKVGVTFTQYIAEKRIALVKELLVNRDLSLQQIAEQAGFCDYFQLSKSFKKHTGMTPGAFRRQDAAQKACPPPMTPGQQQKSLDEGEP